MHGRLHPPQCAALVRVSTQAPAHDVSVAAQAAPPTTHFVPAVTQTPLHSDCPIGHTHVPAEHCSPPGHGRSHAPQFRLLESVSTHAWSHAVTFALHDAAHVPSLQ